VAVLVELEEPAELLEVTLRLVLLLLLAVAMALEIRLTLLAVLAVQVVVAHQMAVRLEAQVIHQAHHQVKVVMAGHPHLGLVLMAVVAAAEQLLLALTVPLQLEVMAVPALHLQ
jgi:hypothetical protein